MEVNPNPQQSTGVNSTGPDVLGNIQRPGEYLRRIRLNKQFEVEQVANELKIPAKTLIALEEDEYTALPEVTFIKGYYRAYAKFLDVDASLIIQRFDEAYEKETGRLPEHTLNNSPIKVMGKLSGSNSERNRKWLKRTALVVVIVVVLIGLVTAIQGWMKSSDSSTATEDQQSNVQVISTDVESSSSGDQLKLEFSHPTSVNIVDATGKVLATGRQSSPMTLSGETPFQIRLDDATAVSLSLNNEKISLTPYTVNGKAEFRLSR